MKLRLPAARLLLAAALLAFLGVTAWLARPVLDLQILINDLDFLPAGSDVLAVDQEIRQAFGSDERLVVGFTSRSFAVTDPEFRADYALFLAALAENRNIHQLLFDRLYRGRFAAGGGEPYALATPDAAWIERALAETVTTGVLATGSSRHTAFAEIPALTRSGVASLEPFLAAAAARVEARRPGEYRVVSVGRYVVLNSLGAAIFDDLIHLLPWSFLIIGMLFWALFRSPTLVGLAVLQSGATVLLTLAIQARLGHPLSLMTAMIPVLVTVLGIADEIHFFSTFLGMRARHPERSAPALAWETLRRLFFPCTAITLTTVIGFASFLATDAPALQVFGLMAGIGLAVSWVISVTLVPVVLALVPIRSRAPLWRLPAFLPRMGGTAVRPWVLIALSALLAPGILRLRIDDGWTRNFRPDHPIVRDVRWLEQESVGIYQLDLRLERRDGRRWTEPALLEALERLRQEIVARPEVTAAITLPDLVRDRAWELGDRAAPRPPLPREESEVRHLLETYTLFNEQVFARMFLDQDEGATRLIFAMANDDYRTATAIRHAVDQAVLRAFPATEVTARVGGSAERGRVLIRSIVGSQGTSVGLSLLASLLVLGVASKRWGRAFACIGANAWALLLVLGAAGWMGIEMGVATSSFLALGVGVGLDYGIHLAFHGGEEHGHGEVMARVAANVVVVAAGLAVLTLSANPTIARLGLLIVLSLIASSLTAVAVFSPGRRAPAAARTAVAEAA